MCCNHSKIQIEGSSTVDTPSFKMSVLLYLYTLSQASYSILTTWNGDEVRLKTVEIRLNDQIYLRLQNYFAFKVRHDPASVTLGSTDTGDLTIHIEARWVDVD